MGRGGQLRGGGGRGSEEAGHQSGLPRRRGLGGVCGRRLEADHGPGAAQVDLDTSIL